MRSLINNHKRGKPSLHENMNKSPTSKSDSSRNLSPKTSSSLYVSNIAQSMSGNCLLLIDPQSDFIDEGGALKVPGAKEDCARIASFIQANKTKFTEIYVTMDTHMRYHIAHPLFWKAQSTPDMPPRHPAPFTQIKHDDVKKGKWLPVDPVMKKWVLEYTRTLERKDERRKPFVLTIWPPHCLIGTKGHNVEEKIAEALGEWEMFTNNTVHYIFKGKNSKTEHYSAFRAEVIVKEDESTQFNTKLYNDLIRHKKIFVAGEALSHCVNFTVRDLVSQMKKKHKSYLEKVILLRGGMSSVNGFENEGEEFWNDMTGDALPAGKKNAKDYVKCLDITTKDPPSIDM